MRCMFLKLYGNKKINQHKLGYRKKEMHMAWDGEKHLNSEIQEVEILKN